MSKNPLIPDAARDAAQSAVELVREKVRRVYAREPSATAEIAEVTHEKPPLSKHQQFMLGLSRAGKSPADIQTAWHAYYAALPDSEKQQVWQEFYAAQSTSPYQQNLHLRKQFPQPIPNRPRTSASGITVAEHAAAETPEAPKKLKHKILHTVSTRNATSTKLKRHAQSLGFGLATGALVIFIMLFTFLNEYVIAPFIQPSRTVSSAPIILADSSTDPSAAPMISIPKINVQIPLNFNVPSTDEADVESGLKTGVVHYSNTSMPGQDGNAAYFGHSAVNIFNNGEKYGFAFTLLHNLVSGDTFYITYGGTTYAYQVFAREVVPPTQVSVISDTKGKTATATLITCDPPGISTNRLVIWGEQISPAPANNVPSTPTTVAATPTALAGNGPSLWSQFIQALQFWK